MPPSNKTKMIRIRVESALKEAAEEMAEERGEGLSVIVRELLRDAIADWKARQSGEIPPRTRTVSRYRGAEDPEPFSPRLNEDSTDDRDAG